jgi:WXG100 family type VII secretion target
MITDMPNDSGPITADSGTLEQGYADLGRSLSNLVSALRELDGQLTASLAEWSGPAREAYDAAHAQWWRAAADLAGTLAWLRGVISVAHANYGSAEDSVLRAFTPGDG